MATLAHVCWRKALRNGALTGLRKRLGENVKRRVKRFWLAFPLRQNQRQADPLSLPHLLLLWSTIRKKRSKPTLRPSRQSWVRRFLMPPRLVCLPHLCRWLMFRRCRKWFQPRQ
jgi:hypothetical protein